MKKEFEWRAGRSSCIFKNFIHLVFVTKYRRDVFTKKTLEQLEELFLETCEQMDVKLIEFGGEDDHAHLRENHQTQEALRGLWSSLVKNESSEVRSPQLSLRLT